MKKLLLVLSLCTLLPALGTSQGLVKVGKTAVKSAVKPPKVPTVSVRPPVTPRVPRSVGTVPHTLGTAVDQTVLRSVDATLPQITTPTLSARAAQEQQVAQLLGEQAQLQAQLQLRSFQTGIGRSVLFAPVGGGKEGGFSVTAIRTSYNGQEEVFGVIASHILPESYYTFSASLKRQFQVRVKALDGTEQLFPAEVVQISPRSMLDISLVKFSPEMVDLLEPLELSDTPAMPQEQLFSYGYAAGQETAQERKVLANSFLSVRTNQNLQGERHGFCGSPLLDANGQVKAIHTGTLEGKNGSVVSYGTHANHIHILLDAYHNNGKAVYDLVLNGQTMAQLNVDEYISAVYLYDLTGKRLVQKNIEDKFSQSLVLKMLEENPQAVYLQLTTRQAHWETDNDGDSILKEDRSKNDKTKRQHWYNLQTQQIEPVRPAVIKQ